MDIDKTLQAYKGKDANIFVSYSHIDAEIVQVEDDVAVIGDGPLPVDWITAEFDQLSRHVAAGHGYDFCR